MVVASKTPPIAPNIKPMSAYKTGRIVFMGSLYSHQNARDTLHYRAQAATDEHDEKDDGAEAEERIEFELDADFLPLL